MAIFHFKLEAVPRGALERYLEAGRPEGYLEDVLGPLGEKDQPSREFLAELRLLLPKDTSWGSVEEYESGNEWGSDLRISHQDEPRLQTPVAWITFRYSTVADPVDLMLRYVELVAAENWVVFSDQLGLWFEPQPELAIAHLKQSRAFRFAGDPYGALEELEYDPVKPPKLPN